MLKDNLLKYGVLRCRDLCTLLYGVPMVTQVRETLIIPSTSIPTPILGLDTRRIKYEIILTNAGAIDADVQIGTPDAILAGTSWDIFLASNRNYAIIRDFRTDLDAVTLPLWALDDGAQNIEINVRETFLTPAPVDEVPV
jgi:hypothetical protein